MDEDKKQNLEVIEDEFQDECQDDCQSDEQEELLGENQDEIDSGSTELPVEDAQDEEKTKYSYAPEVQEIAARLIDAHHSHLAEARIRYLFREGKWTSKGKTVLGKAKLASEDVRFLGAYDFVVIINHEVWNYAKEEYRKALVDHELTHCDCGYDAQDNKRWSIAEHDVTEFVSIVSRHGLWESAVQKLMVAAKNGPYVQGPHNQIGLFEAKSPEEPGTETDPESGPDQEVEPVDADPGESPVNQDDPVNRIRGAGRARPAPVRPEREFRHNIRPKEKPRLQRHRLQRGA